MKHKKLSVRSTYEQKQLDKHLRKGWVVVDKYPSQTWFGRNNGMVYMLEKE